MRETRYRHTLTVGYAASAVTIALTAAAFWLSYEHLAGVASDNGLPGVRGWAWPATVDLFIVLGELLVLRASLRRKKDFFAYSITASGSLASIALNVAGVGQDASRMEYVVAGVPPVAALLAFAALMRQVHEALSHQVVLPAPPLPLQAPVEAPVVDLEAEEEFLEEAGDPQVSDLESASIDQETLVEKLVANGEPLPGRTTVMKTYGVTAWVARRALEIAKERLQETDQTLQLTKEN